MSEVTLTTLIGEHDLGGRLESSARFPLWSRASTADGRTGDKDQVPEVGGADSMYSTVQDSKDRSHHVYGHGHGHGHREEGYENTSPRQIL